MTSTQRVQDALLPAGDPDVRIIAGHVHRRTDRHTSAAAPPPPKSKSKSGTGLNKAEIKRSGIGDNGDSDSDEEERRRRFQGGDVEDSLSTVKVSRQPGKASEEPSSGVLLRDQEGTESLSVIRSDWEKTKLGRKEFLEQRLIREAALIKLHLKGEPFMERYEKVLKDKILSIGDEALVGDELAGMNLSTPLEDVVGFLDRERHLEQLLAEVEKEVIRRLQHFAPEDSRMVLSELGPIVEETGNKLNPLGIHASALAADRKSASGASFHKLPDHLPGSHHWSLEKNTQASEYLIFEYWEALKHTSEMLRERDVGTSFESPECIYAQWWNANLPRFKNHPWTRSRLGYKIIERGRGFSSTRFECICTGDNIAMLLFKDGELWRKRDLHPSNLSYLGWHGNGPYWDELPIDERFWRYRVGTESGDMRYIFKVQMNEAVIGIWSPRGDIEWRDDLKEKKSQVKGTKWRDNLKEL
jgi:hypothetical protein